jgi:hypothetical protein
MTTYLVRLVLTMPDPPSAALTMLSQEFGARSFAEAAARAQRWLDHWAGRGLWRVSTVERVG